ncbi:MAG: metalloregulator ArsR/SmtB family transcription factor [Candidatus Aminicenantaceae bacterium]
MTAVNQAHKKLAKKFRVLGHPVRIKLLEDLMKKECCVGEIQKGLSVSQPNASQHLKILKEAGIIEARREKNKICYRIVDKAVVQAFKILKKEV